MDAFFSRLETGMTKRPLSMTPANVERREQRTVPRAVKMTGKRIVAPFAGSVDRNVACGGTIIPLSVVGVG